MQDSGLYNFYQISSAPVDLYNSLLIHLTFRWKIPLSHVLQCSFKVYDGLKFMCYILVTKKTALFGFYCKNIDLETCRSVDRYYCISRHVLHTPMVSA
jgi:hypothetical protein